MSASLLDILNTLSDVTDQLLSALQQEAWDRVETLQTERQLLATQAEAMQMPTDKAESEQASRLIIQLKQTNSDIAERIRLNQQRLVSQRQTHNKGQKMKKAYQGR